MTTDSPALPEGFKPLSRSPDEFFEWLPMMERLDSAKIFTSTEGGMRPIQPMISWAETSFEQKMASVAR